MSAQAAAAGGGARAGKQLLAFEAHNRSPTAADALKPKDNKQPPAKGKFATNVRAKEMAQRIKDLEAKLANANAQVDNPENRLGVVRAFVEEKEAAASPSQGQGISMLKAMVGD